MTNIKDIIDLLEDWAPISYAESYDNVGLLVGDVKAEVKGVVVSLDCTEAVIQEAMDKGCNLVVSHHPIVFKGIKKFTGGDYVSRTITMAIKNDIALYAIHTNLDNVHNGVNRKIADLLALENARILSPKRGKLKKITFFVPISHASEVKDSIFKVGGGEIGNYSECSFSTDGIGTFKPGNSADPFSGEVGKLQKESEERVEIMFPDYLSSSVMRALKANHPYEEVAYYLHELDNTNENLGSGMIGTLSEPMPIGSFLENVKDRLGLKVLKYTPNAIDMISKVAVCGGSGSFLLGNAKRAGADIFISSDFKYHEFFDAENQIVIADIGHYESERFTVNLIGEFISKKFSTFATHLTGVNTNPIDYI